MDRKCTIQCKVGALGTVKQMPAHSSSPALCVCVSLLVISGPDKPRLALADFQVGGFYTKSSICVPAGIVATFVLSEGATTSKTASRKLERSRRPAQWRQVVLGWSSRRRTRPVSCLNFSICSQGASARVHAFVIITAQLAPAPTWPPVCLFVCLFVFMSSGG